ncbi:hypothetical protein StoSoilB5_22490 [Arthrobacter sp. StoSoilB5]|nr:hypothetical protein StoSoilB5_22490 [Arthrobacter sp. StoSoilB5]
MTTDRTRAVNALTALARVNELGLDARKKLTGPQIAEVSQNQLGAPTAYLAAGALILVFAVGFTSMGRHLPNPGAFYACITAGLGKPLGLGASFLAVVSYFFILVGGYAFGGISLEALVTDVLGGPEVPWWAYTLQLMTIFGTLGVLQDHSFREDSDGFHDLRSDPDGGLRCCCLHQRWSGRDHDGTF